MQKILFGIIIILFIGLGYVAFTSFNNSSNDGAQQQNQEDQMTDESDTSMEDTEDTSDSTGDSTGSERSFTLAEVAAHASADDCYSVINGSVYNLTSFVGNHPGGQAILKICGIDGSAIFNAQHGGGAQQAAILATLKIGVLAQ